MASISKRVSGSWVSGDERVMKTATDTITTLPADLYADGTNATVGLVGNMQQTGAPTPTTPITPSECGNKTANLFDKNANIIWHNNVILDDTGNEISSNSSGYTNPFTEVESNTTYTLNGELSQYGGGTAGGYRVYYYQDSTFLSRSTTMNNNNKTFTTPQNCNRIALQCQIINNYPHLDTVMLNLGSTAIPYQPYGYVLPVKTGVTTTSVCLGDVQTTRKIQKLVLTGQETSQQLIMQSSGLFYVKIAAQQTMSEGICISSHYKNEQVPNVNMTNYAIKQDWSSTYGGIIVIKHTDYTSVDDFKNYFAEQYANGTPVTVWYALTNPTTTTINEPLRKIGDYSDSTSVTGIPTTAGDIEFDVDTTLKPSEVSLTYHGWHDISPLKRENGQWV